MHHCGKKTTLYIVLNKTFKINTVPPVYSVRRSTGVFAVVVSLILTADIPFLWTVSIPRCIQLLYINTCPGGYR